MPVTIEGGPRLDKSAIEFKTIIESPRTENFGSGKTVFEALAPKINTIDLSRDVQKNPGRSVPDGN